MEEAEKLVRSLKRTVRQNMAICDKKTAGVLEITPKTVILRRSVEGICACTNHFRTPELATDTTCGRYSILERSRKTSNSMWLGSPSRWMPSTRAIGPFRR